MSKNSILLAPLLATLFTGCSLQEASFPSLAKRDFEREDTSKGPVSTPVAAKYTGLAPAMAKDVAKQLAKSEAAISHFKNNQDAVRQLADAALGAEVSSESWVAAQLAISNLETDRTDSVSALASLDRHYIVRLEQEESGAVARGGANEINMKRDSILNSIKVQDAVLDALKAKLKPSA